MKLFFTIIKSEYLQRTRSYAFLITLCASLAIAYTFVPEPNANYSTIRIADYVGYYNSAWFGYVTAIMTSIFLSLIGFYLVNSGIKKDIETKVGHIVASTPISNFKYLFSIVLSNFLILLTIVAVVFMMSIVLFMLYNDGYPFEPLQFIKPYLIITIPALFFIAVLAVIFEIFFGRYSVFQNVIFFFLFSFLVLFTPKSEAQFSLDIFGSKIVINQLEETVREISDTEKTKNLTIGYVIGNVKEAKRFDFNGIDFPTSFIISRLGLILLGIGIIAVVSVFFHRFNIKERVSLKSIKTIEERQRKDKDIILSNLPKPQIDYGIFLLIKTECLLLFRKGKKWLWLFNILGMILLVVLPIKIAHQMALPILWFLQVSRLSDLTTKEQTNHVHYFAFSSYKPLSRLLLSQLFAGTTFMLALTLPLIVRLALNANFSGALAVSLGTTFIVLSAASLGILSKGKKLFEVLFFMLTYANINGIPFVDYFGGFTHDKLYIIQLFTVATILTVISVLLRRSLLKG